MAATPGNCASEGVPLAYRIITVSVKRYDGRERRAYTLQAAVRFPGGALERAPSRRYLDLIRDGARESGLRDSWLEKLDSISPALEPARQPRAYERRAGATFI